MRMMDSSQPPPAGAHRQSSSSSSSCGDAAESAAPAAGAAGGGGPQQQAAANNTYHLKILVPSVAAGAIIGKGGETIAALQKECGARVKMSKSNDFYPGTSERVCLISGSVDGIMRIHNFIMEKIKEKPDRNARSAIDFDHKIPAEREKQVKILVPNSTAGMIIGKAGSYIKQIKEESGAYVQLSQKSRDHALAERSITVIGELEPTQKAVKLVLAKIVEDPQSGSCLNVSYADVQGPVANFNPTGSPYANPAMLAAAGNLQSLAGVLPGHASVQPGSATGPALNSNGSVAGNSLSPTGHIHQQQHYTITPHTHLQSHQAVSSSAGGPAAGASSAQGAGSHSVLTGHNLESLKLILRQNGFAEQATTEILGAFSVLATYGLLGSSVSGQLLNGQPSPLASSAGVAPIYSSAAATGDPSSLFGPIGSLSGFTSPTTATAASSRSPLQTAGAYDPFRRSSTPPALATPPPGSASQQQVHHHSQVTAHSSGGSSGASSNAQIVNNNSFGLGTAGGGVSATGGAASPLGAGSLVRKSPTPSEPVVIGGASKPSATAVSDAVQEDIEIGESIVGAILGPGGKSLVEIQRFSGALIQISKKGNFAPGTRNRIVTVMGSPNAVATALYLIRQHVAEEESKRSHYNIMAAVTHR